MTAQFLSDEQFAEYFLGQNTVAPGADVLDLEPLVQTWLDRVGMAHRRAFPIAIEAAKLARPAPPRLPSPEEAARLDDLHQGIGDQRPLTEAELADRVGEMSVAEYANFRQQLGVGQPDVVTFLGGSQ